MNDLVLDVRDQETHEMLERYAMFLRSLEAPIRAYYIELLMQKSIPASHRSEWMEMLSLHFPGESYHWVQETKAPKLS